MSLGMRIGRSVGIAAIIGFAGFLLSASPLSWLLSAGVFYWDFWGRGEQSWTPIKRGK